MKTYAEKISFLQEPAIKAGNEKLEIIPGYVHGLLLVKK